MSNISKSQKIDSCLISGGPTVKVLDFGQHAYADTFIAEDQLHLSEPVFPLQVFLNNNSGHLQLGYVSNDSERYNLYSYSYTSSNSNTARTHWDNYAASMLKKYQPKGLVIEIGSNDGYLIDQFLSRGPVLGIDTSEEMCKISQAQGIPTLNRVFCESLAEEIKNSHGFADLVIANNVFNHANDPVNFAQGVEKLLSDSGVFVFEVPYWLSMVESGRFTDMVYHEHVSYFTIKSVWHLLQKAGLEIVEFDIVDYHGGSLRVVAKKSSGSEASDIVAHAIMKETAAGLFDPMFYLGLQRQFEDNRNDWLAKFYHIKSTEPKAIVIGVGAAAKANTWLTWHGLNKNDIYCITDSSKHKQNKYTPLSRIPIKGDDEFANHPSPYALILSWNISEGLKKALLDINPNTRFITQ
jgi:SAM-dependent methyltransferase